MANRQYNLNTKYGRRKARQQAQENYNNMTPGEQSDHDFMSCLVTVIILAVVGLFIFLLKGWDGLLKWLSN